MILDIRDIRMGLTMVPPTDTARATCIIQDMDTAQGMGIATDITTDMVATDRGMVDTDPAAAGTDQIMVDTDRVAAGTGQTTVETDPEAVADTGQTLEAPGRTSAGTVLRM